MEIPKEPKRYTTVYGNFKGVDFTNDPTNVYRLRSPDGLNMIPDMDGSPRKRHGWEVEITTEDIKEVFVSDLDGENVYVDVNATPFSSSWLINSEGQTGGSLYCNNIVGTYDSGVYTDGTGEHYGEIWSWDEDNSVFVLYRQSLPSIPSNLRYFEIGGVDFILAFNSYGLFVYSDVPDIFGRKLRLVRATPFKADKSFFFEGQGTTGYYVWDGLDLYMFGGFNDNNNIIFSKVTPYYPITHIACTPNLSSSTMYENVNMLTAYRRIQYMGDGASTHFNLPISAKSVSSISAEVLNTITGQWSSATIASGTTTSEVVLSSAPAPSTEDNVRITYEAGGSALTPIISTVTRPYQSVSLQCSGTQTYARAQYTSYSGTLVHVTTPTSTTWGTSVASKKLAFDTSNIDISTGTPQYTVQYSKSGTATTLGTSYRSVTFGSYNSTCNVTVGKTLYDSTITTTSDKTAYGSYSSKSGTVKWGSAVQRTAAAVTLAALGFTDAQINTMLNNSATSSITYYKYTRTATRTKTYSIRVQYTKKEIQSTSIGGSAEARSAFQTASRATIYGNGLINQVFIGAVGDGNYKNRIWYSGTTDPTYFPDLNYFEAGSNDTAVMGMIKVGEYLGIIKQGSTLDSSVYLAYPTSFNEDTAYAIKQKVAGVGAVSNGAFNVLNDEPLFLSSEGVMAIVPNENEEKQLKNRSYYINKKLLAEDGLENAVSFVWKNMYLLAINNLVYILDGAQKSSWANERTNLQYECYYCDNIPAKCFARIDEQLWFADHHGNLCRFKDDNSQYPWFDEYSISGDELTSLTISHKVTLGGTYSLLSDNDVINPEVAYEYYGENGTHEFLFTSHSAYVAYYKNDDEEYGAGWLLDSSRQPFTPTRNQVFFCDVRLQDENIYFWDGEKYRVLVSPTYITYVDGYVCYTFSDDNGVFSLGDIGVLLLSSPDENNNLERLTVTIEDNDVTGYPILTRWTTIMDDDGMPHYFKNLQKKGTMVILTPSSDSGVTVSLRADNKDPIVLGEVDVRSEELPFDVYTKKKVKKYKRLQFILENDGLLDSFGIDQIIKSYTVGNYSKNR